MSVALQVDEAPTADELRVNLNLQIGARDEIVRQLAAAREDLHRLQKAAEDAEDAIEAGRRAEDDALAEDIEAAAGGAPSAAKSTAAGLQLTELQRISAVANGAVQACRRKITKLEQDKLRAGAMIDIAYNKRLEPLTLAKAAQRTQKYLELVELDAELAILSGEEVAVPAEYRQLPDYNAIYDQIKASNAVARRAADVARTRSDVTMSRDWALKNRVKGQTQAVCDRLKVQIDAPLPEV
jgi:hypothetical protein